MINYKKELSYLNNLEQQFRIIGQALETAKKAGLKTITLKDYGIQNTKKRPRVGEDKISK